MRMFTLLLLTLFLIACGGGGGETTPNPPPPPPPPPPPGGITVRTEDVVTGAAFPVSLAFAPDGRLFYTEKNSGNVRIVQNGQLLPTPFVTVTPLASSGEQGLLGIAFDPNFATNGFVYLYHTAPGPLRNRIIRFTEANNVGTNETLIFDNIPAASNHNGGRLGFGPDGMLYATAGDAGNPANAASTTCPCGKVLRLNPDGSIPGDNPVAGEEMLARGLRNPFGLDFHPTAGTPYVTDNGPSCDDEVNRIVAGGHYGWRPNYPCGDTDPAFVAPIAVFNPQIAPTGLVFYSGTVFPEWENHLFVASFNDGLLRRLVVDEAANGNVLETHTVINGTLGPLIDVTVGPDGNLYIATETAVIRVLRGP